MKYRFLFTGSRLYGNPKRNSDFDLVMAYDSRSTVEISDGHWSTHMGVIELLGNRANSTEDACGQEIPDVEEYAVPQVDYAMRFGPINLICVSRLVQWSTWRSGTYSCCVQAKLEKKGYVVRSYAVNAINRRFRELSRVMANSLSPGALRMSIPSAVKAEEVL
jgi:hypothetical protein